MFTYPKPNIADCVNPTHTIIYRSAFTNGYSEWLRHRSFDSESDANIFCQWLIKEFRGTQYKVVPYFIPS